MEGEVRGRPEQLVVNFWLTLIRNIMIKRLQTLLQDANKRNEITTQTLSSFRVPKFEDERMMRTKLLMLENENLRLKDELDNLLKKTTKVNKKVYFDKDDEDDVKQMMELRGAMKAENNALKRELKDIQLSKEAMVFEHDGLSKDKEILRLRGVIQEYRKKENRSFPTYANREGDANFNEKWLIVKMMNKRFDKDLMKYLFTIWRFKFLLKRALRLKGDTVAFNFREDIRKAAGNSQTVMKQSKLLWLWEQLRTAIAMRIFEIFLRSKTEEKESKSYIIFKINIEEFIGNDDRLLTILLSLYTEMINSLGDLIPNNPRIQKLKKLAMKNLDAMEIDDYKDINPYGIYDPEVRDTINEWVENQIAQVQQRRKVTGKDKVHKEMVTLFRLLAIYYKCQYPYSNKHAYRVDKDLVSYLENLVCKTISRLVSFFEKNSIPAEDPDEF